MRGYRFLALVIAALATTGFVGCGKRAINGRMRVVAVDAASGAPLSSASFAVESKDAHLQFPPFMSAGSDGGCVLPFTLPAGAGGGIEAEVTARAAGYQAKTIVIRREDLEAAEGGGGAKVVGLARYQW